MSRQTPTRSWSSTRSMMARRSLRSPPSVLPCRGRSQVNDGPQVSQVTAQCATLPGEVTGQVTMGSPSANPRVNRRPRTPAQVSWPLEVRGQVNRHAGVRSPNRRRNSASPAVDLKNPPSGLRLCFNFQSSAFLATSDRVGSGRVRMGTVRLITHPQQSRRHLAECRTTSYN